MPEENQTASSPFARPSARAAAMPVQRGNYGIPPRQSAPTPQPTGPLMMDVAPRRPAPAPAAQTPVAAPVTAPPQPQPVAAPAPVSVRPAPEPNPEVQQSAPAPIQPLQSVQKPLFTSAPAPVTPKKVRFQRTRKLATKARFALLIVGALLTIGGVARVFTVTDTSKYNVGVAAVVTNDSSTMTMQFVADDGKLHKFSAPSNPNMIPGTAVEITYRPGAADSTITQVSTLKRAHNLGMVLLSAGVTFLIIAGVMFAVTFRRKPKLTAPTPVTVAA